MTGDRHLDVIDGHVDRAPGPVALVAVRDDLATPLRSD
jgi:hypothetical protein